MRRQHPFFAFAILLSTSAVLTSCLVDKASETETSPQPTTSLPVDALMTFYCAAMNASHRVDYFDCLQRRALSPKNICLTQTNHPCVRVKGSCVSRNTLEGVLGGALMFLAKIASLPKPVFGLQSEYIATFMTCQECRKPAPWSNIATRSESTTAAPTTTPAAAAAAVPLEPLLVTTPKPVTATEDEQPQENHPEPNKNLQQTDEVMEDHQREAATNAGQRLSLF